MPDTPGILAGRLDKRVTLLKPDYNPEQDEIIAWVPVTTVWAGIMPSSGREATEASRTVALTLIDIIIRYRTDIDARWRIQDRDHTYQIRTIVDVLRRHVQLQLACEEVQ